MSLKTRGILVLVIGTILGVSLSVGGDVLAGRDKPKPRELKWEQARLLAEVMDRVRRDYVEPIDDAELVEKAIRGMVGDLDRHSAFLDADEYQDIRISTSWLRMLYRRMNRNIFFSIYPTGIVIRGVIFAVFPDCSIIIMLTSAKVTLLLASLSAI